MALIASILSKFDDSGIKKAKHEFGGLKKVAAGLGIGMGLKAITEGLLDAAKAAAADKKSMDILNSILVKNAKATSAQVKANNSFIDTMSIQSGIVDDDLRPSMGKFARVTGNVSQAQKLLKTALNASAYAGVPLEKVSTALSKAYTGNTSSLIRLFPELKKSKDAIGDLSIASEGFAQKNADPFMRFNNAMDTLKESLGYVILPMISDFVDEISKPGGLIDITKKYLEDLSNPKTEAGATFQSIKDAVNQTFNAVKDFFALFGGGDAMKGFANVASSLVTMLPALIALKGILFLAKSTTVLANLAKAIGLMQAGNVAGGTVVAGKGKGGPIPLGVAGALLTVGMILTTKGDAGPVDEAYVNQKNLDNEKYKALKKQAADLRHETSPFFNPAKNAPIIGNQVVINNYSADPKAVVDAVTKYVKTNGAVPSNWNGYGGKR